MIEHDPEHAELAAITAVIPSFSDHRVLEIGCGDGRLTRHYASRAAAVTAVDPDQQAITECRAAVHGSHFVAYAIGFEEFQAPAHSYDVIILSWSL
ncbi:MAG TPA: class I SAM-dependent methyltransferase [Candidatus Cybelea sp.]|nr:class I SAM-dependent methyltransferase [Candidatus Cybelea sp.]